jgi:lipopolysaccharide transport system ATP-binding protein
MSTAIKVENLSKIYRLGEIGTGTITQDIDRWFKTKVLGKEDPFLKIGENNDRTRKGNGDIVYSLQDINFEINQGDAVGIIGRNGAGKSTLLKILSRVTTPTTGKINIKGRVASLLEVGTGFHPELTGRENIYLNGAILGMRKREIDRKLDEIIDFSGVERYIDTPVKRYSSGMYVRLAFAVAAHLESEILIVDEVLAVGDAEFQKKCLGKMGEVSKGEGRTVLFVSHNMAAVSQLCNKSIVVEHGVTVFEGKAKDGIGFYLKSNQSAGNIGFYRNETNEKSCFIGLAITDKNNEIKTEFGFDEPITLNIDLLIEDKHLNAYIGFRVEDGNERVIFTSEIKLTDIINKAGVHHFQIKLPHHFLVPNKFKITFGLHIPNIEIIDYREEILSFEILETGSNLHKYTDINYGCVFANCNWDLIRSEYFTTKL